MPKQYDVNADDAGVFDGVVNRRYHALDIPSEYLIPPTQVPDRANADDLLDPEDTPGDDLYNPDAEDVGEYSWHGYLDGREKDRRGYDKTTRLNEASDTAMGVIGMALSAMLIMAAIMTMINNALMTRATAKRLVQRRGLKMEVAEEVGNYLQRIIERKIKSDDFIVDDVMSDEEMDYEHGKNGKHYSIMGYVAIKFSDMRQLTMNVLNIVAGEDENAGVDINSSESDAIVFDVIAAIRDSIEKRQNLYFVQKMTDSLLSDKSKLGKLWASKLLKHAKRKMKRPSKSLKVLHWHPYAHTSTPLYDDLGHTLFIVELIVTMVDPLDMTADVREESTTAPKSNLHEGELVNKIALGVLERAAMTLASMLATFFIGKLLTTLDQKYKDWAATKAAKKKALERFAARALSDLTAMMATNIKPDAMALDDSGKNFAHTLLLTHAQILSAFSAETGISIGDIVSERVSDNIIKTMQDSILRLDKPLMASFYNAHGKAIVEYIEAKQGTPINVQDLKMSLTCINDNAQRVIKITFKIVHK
jgi:hypothetical protein